MLVLVGVAGDRARVGFVFDCLERHCRGYIFILVKHRIYSDV